MPPASQSEDRNAGQEIRSTIGRVEEADKAASVTKTGFGGKVRRARKFAIGSDRNGLLDPGTQRRSGD